MHMAREGRWAARTLVLPLFYEMMGVVDEERKDSGLE